jgi:predicted enzyme related to lactoylglutathione lyase
MQQGQFFWYDVMTTDTKAAAKFYGAVVGWGTQDAGEGYTLFTVNGQGVAGLMAIPEHAKGMPPCWLGYIWADDVDAMCTRLEQEGGKILRPPMDIPGIIRFAVVADPQGAGFLVAKAISPETPPTPLPFGTPGTIGWRELMAGEWKAAFAFYEKLFGWTKAEAIEMGPMGTYQLFATGAQPTGGMMTKPNTVPVPNWGYYFNVDAINAAIERVKANGGTVLMGPTEVPGPMFVAQCLDPLGAYFALVAPKH